VDLSGIWAGTCANLPGPAHITIRQYGCSRIGMMISYLDPDGNLIDLRAFDTTVGTREVFRRIAEGAPELRFVRTKSEWRDNGTALWARDVIKVDGVTIATGSGRFYIENNQLKLDVDDDNGSGDCTFNRLH